MTIAGPVVWLWRRSWAKKLEFVTIVLALVATGLAIIQYEDSKTLEKHTQRTLTELDALVQQSSTKYLGTFPNNMDDIVRVASATHKELRILSDIPGYGHYSQPERFELYKKAMITAARSGYPVRMLYYSPAVQRNSAEDQFNERKWEEIRSDRRFHEFFLNHPEYPHDTYQQFAASLLKIQESFETILCVNGVQIEHYNEPSAVFFWVADDRTAVFAINSRDEKGREETFATSDGKLTDAFSSIFERLWQDNRNDPEACHGEQHASLGR